MKKYFLLLILTYPLVFISCSENREKLKLIASQEYFLNSLEYFDDANNITEEIKSDKQDVKFENFEVLLKKIEYGVKESEKVSDTYLDKIHPKLKSMYRDNLINNYIIFLENIDTINKEKSFNLNYQLHEEQLQFWNFIESYKVSINSKMKIINKRSIAKKVFFAKKIIKANENKKSFWRMFFRFLISSFIFIFIFSLLVIILMIPLAIFGKLLENFNPTATALLITIPFTLLAGIGQAILWILWSAYCVFTMHFFIDSPEVSHKWIYYLTSFLWTTGPIGWLSYKEKQSADNISEQKKINVGANYYSLIIIVAFITLTIWPNLLEFKYFVWINNWIY